MAGEAYDHHKGSAPLLRPTNRWRTGLFLSINLAGFLLVNAFWLYLSSGKWADFSPAAYHRSLATPLGQVLIRPLSVFTHPWMILVLGLLLGVVVRLLVAGAFVSIIAVFGHAPVLAVAVGIGCLLAARTPLRSDMPFLAALLGLLPVAVYLYLFAFLGTDAAALAGQQLVLSLPFFVGGVGAILSAAVVLALARVTGFRPGAIWPVLAVLLAAPAAMFYTRIGVDELQYALISDELAWSDEIFSPVLLRDWRLRHDAAGLTLAKLKVRIEGQLAQRRHELARRCEAFVARFPASRRVPAILWLQAQALSLQLHAPGLELETPVVRFSASYPSQASAEIWRRLVTEYGQAPHAALARVRLGVMALRARQVDRAEKLLREAIRQLRSELSSMVNRRARATEFSLFFPPPQQPPQAYYSEMLLAAERLIWLIERNDLLTDPPAAEATAAYLQANPHQLDYRQRLGRLAETYEGTKMGDNLKLAVALATPNLYERAEMLILLAEDERTDSAIEANYHLGHLALRTREAPALGLVEKLKSPREYFQLVVAAPKNPWQELAAFHLAALKTAQTATSVP